MWYKLIALGLMLFKKVYRQYDTSQDKHGITIAAVLILVSFIKQNIIPDFNKIHHFRTRRFANK